MEIKYHYLSLKQILKLKLVEHLMGKLKPAQSQKHQQENISYPF